MITGKMFIDDVDVKSTYGAYIVDGGYDDVPAFPALKSPERNEWFESNSVEVDLSDPCVESQKISFVFKMNGDMEDLQSFVDFIMSKRSHSVNMVDIGRTRPLRVIDVSASSISSICTIRVNMSDDEPREGVFYIEPPVVQRKTNLLIDGRDVSYYGCVVTGSIDGLFPNVQMKENKLVDSEHIDGQIHSNSSGTYVEKDDLKIRLVMRSESTGDFWMKRDSMFFFLTKPGERTISWKGRESRVYYKDCNSVDFDYFGRCWWEFELTFGYIGE